MHIRNTILGALLALALAACGDDSGFGGGGDGTPNGPSGAKPIALMLSASQNSINTDGSESSQVRALLVDANNVVVANVPVAFSATSGALSTGLASSNSDGVAQVNLTTGGDSSSRTITVTAKASGLTSTIAIGVGAAPSTNPVSNLTIASSVGSLPADGSAQATITATVLDTNNLLLSGVQVNFTSNSGGLQVTKSQTGSDGKATAILSTAGDPTPRDILVTASAGGITKPITVHVTPAATAATVAIGNGSGATFTANVVKVGVVPPNSIPAGSSTSLSVNFVDPNNNNLLYTSPVTVTFNSPCVASGKATITPASTQTTNGQANAIYQANGCAGTDQITATATVGGQNLQASAPVSIAAASVGSIVFVSASPANIALKGMGIAARPELSTLVFRVTDAAGGAVPGQNVTFSASTTVGGLSVTPTATSDASGNVSAIVTAGTVATPVIVTATVAASPNITTQSSSLTISTGIPTAGSFSLSIDKPNIEGFDYDGAIAKVTVRLADRFSNPVPDGTPVSFQAEGGSIGAQCLTTTTADEGGICSVSFRSSNPRPSDGRVSILATAIGEESFTDTDGNGIFNSGGNDATTYTDLGEPWLDLNENGVYDVGEPFYDFFNSTNGGSSGVRDAPNGKFNGALCDNAGNLCGSSKTLGIGARGTIVMSTSAAFIRVDNGTPGGTLTTSGPLIALLVSDVKGNPMPVGTTVKIETTGPGVQISGTTSYTVISNSYKPGTPAIQGQTYFPFSISGTGKVTITVTTLNQVVTTQIITIN
jgi:hypothetical protein